MLYHTKLLCHDGHRAVPFGSLQYDFPSCEPMMLECRNKQAPEIPGSCNRQLSGNDPSPREAMWRRWPGDEWAALEALPPIVRLRVQEGVYDAWVVNTLMLWRIFHRQTANRARAEKRLLRYLDECEALELAAFDAAYRKTYRLPLPHVAADASVLRMHDFREEWRNRSSSVDGLHIDLRNKRTLRRKVRRLRSQPRL
jgi:hypothetical protein